MRYLIVQIKRANRIFPHAFLACVILNLAVILFATVLFSTRDGNEKNFNLNVGYAGSLDDYMGMNLNNMMSTVGDDFGITFVPTDEEQAVSMMNEGRLSTCVVFPEGLVESLDSGLNDKKIVFLSNLRAPGIGGMIMSEAMNSTSSVVYGTQAAYSATYDALYGAGFPERITEAYGKLDSRFLRMMLNFVKSVETERVGVSGGLSFKAYYIAALLLVFASFSCLAYAGFFTSDMTDVTRKYICSGHNGIWPAFCEWCVFIFFQLINMIFVMALFGLLIGRGTIAVREFENGLSDYVKFCLSAVPGLILIFTTGFFLYSLTSNVISAVLLQFMSGILLCFAAGLFLPDSFLPEQLNRIGNMLPTGVSMKLLTGVLRNGAGKTKDVWCYTAVLLCCSAVVRKIRLRRE